MTYEFIQDVGPNEAPLLWGTFRNSKQKMFLFVSYLLGTTVPETFYIREVETGKVVQMVKFAAHHGITKEDIKTGRTF